jgi:hypothetical protein
MNALTLPVVTAPSFSIAAVDEPQRIAVRLTGTADMKAKKPLAAFLVALHKESTKRSVEEVTVDIRDLEFISSSCFKDFVTWLCTVQEGPAEERYKIIFLSNPDVHWQRRSLHSLTCFASDLASVQG